jgi:hypothetical protein
MTLDEVRSLYHAQPFCPFVLHLADGRAIRVEHPEYLAAAPSGRTITVYQPDDTLNIVDLLLVTDVEIKPAGNGTRKRRKS